jgi:hypothetical protein
MGPKNCSRSMCGLHFTMLLKIWKQVYWCLLLSREIHRYTCKHASHSFTVIFLSSIQLFWYVFKWGSKSLIFLCVNDILTVEFSIFFEITISFNWFWLLHALYYTMTLLSTSIYAPDNCSSVLFPDIYSITSIIIINCSLAIISCKCVSHCLSIMS